jgi:chemotaxis protein CheD
MPSSPCPVSKLQNPVAQARSGVFLYPGQIFVSDQAEFVSTILGSCVSVCLWDRMRRVGGINHFLLPYEKGERPGTERMGDVAMNQLLARMGALGCRDEDLTAKVFGGANVLKGANRASGHSFHVGEENVEVAMAFLSRASISVVAEDVLGPHGRKVIYNTGDGSVWVRQL